MSISQEDASAAARDLARARWGTRGLDRAIETLTERQAELGAEQRAELRAIAETETSGG